MRKIFTQEELIPLKIQMVKCLANISNQVSIPMSDEQARVVILRILRDSAESSNAIKAASARQLDELGAPLEAMAEEDIPMPTKLEQTIRGHFDTVIELIKLRTQNDKDLLNSANRDVNAARIALKALQKNPLYREMKPALEIVLKEFDAAAMLARTDDLTLTRDAALEILEKQNGRGNGY